MTTSEQHRPRLILARGKEKALQRRHPWIFSGAIARVEGAPQEGDVVDVLSAQGAWMAVGHYQHESIAVKVISYDNPAVDEALWAARFRSALDYRQRLGLFGDLGRTNAFRLVNGEGDRLPGLIADLYGDVLVLQAHSVGMHRLFPLFAPMLAAQVQGRGVRLRALFDKSSATLRDGTAVQDGFIWGEAEADGTFLEEGNALAVNFYDGQKTGAFLDQRVNHARVRALAKGTRVLNAFGYTGAFSLAALRGGADYVETVDISRRAIELCQSNVEANFPHAPHKGVVADAMRYLDDLPRDFDLVILDPPAFAKTHRTLQQGLKGYRNINQKAMAAIRPGGLLFTFSCSQAVGMADFRTMAFSAAALARRHVRVVRDLHHAPDHPVSIFHPEGDYLKGLLLQVE